MTKTMKAAECKAKFFDVLDEVASKCERVIVTRNGKPVAEIVPFVERPKSIVGALKGSVTIMGDLDEPLDIDRMGSAQRMSLLVDSLFARTDARV